MATSKEIEAGAKAIAEDLRLPGGGLKKLARVIEDHLGWFDAAEARGLTWADMSRLLFAVEWPSLFGGDPVFNGLAETRRCQTYWQGHRFVFEIGQENSRLRAGIAIANSPIGPRADMERERRTAAQAETSSTSDTRKF